ncbi:MAG TPA: DUF2189 domain-containing protein [Terriglobia bacterium]|nr:DUF2189 domain-containing protein [Terriglobia bacterium]
MDSTIRNPVEWGWDQVKHAGAAIESAGRSLLRTEDRMQAEKLAAPMPAVRRIGIEDLRAALIQGSKDFGAYRTDVIFLCVIYPVAGLVLARLAFGYEMLPLIFPLASGFALVGPFAAIGLYEMSRRREQGAEITWLNAFDVLRSPNITPIAVLGLILMALFLLWLAAAEVIYIFTLGPDTPVSIAAFLHDIFYTPAGLALVAFGCGVGFLFAVLVLSISVVSFPLLLDRDIGLGTAVRTSMRAVERNPRIMAAWGAIIVAALILGTIPLFIGLIVVMPVLGHATWHLYRKIVPR